jgi:hypothetical protein
MFVSWVVGVSSLLVLLRMVMAHDPHIIQNRTYAMLIYL